MYSKPSVLITSTMKSLPLLPRVSGSSAAGGAVSAALLGSGTGLRGAGACAAASRGAARAAAPAIVAPFRNRRRFSFGTSCLDMAVPPRCLPDDRSGRRGGPARRGRTRSFRRPWQAFGDASSHDPRDVVRRQELHFLGKQRDGLPIGAAGARQHCRQVGSPEATLRAERLDDAPDIGLG